MGQLIPAKEYKLIPLRALEGLEIEIRLNPYAFFTTSLHTDDNTTPANRKMAPRSWYIKNI
jgi:hypothetical protein